jgi:hypothetical protein
MLHEVFSFEIDEVRVRYVGSSPWRWWGGGDDLEVSLQDADD